MGSYYLQTGFIDKNVMWLGISIGAKNVLLLTKIFANYIITGKFGISTCLGCDLDSRHLIDYDLAYPRMALYHYGIGSNIGLDYDYVHSDKISLKADIDLLFIPSNNEIYGGTYSELLYENYMFKILEGESRPHFFNGVCIVVAKLFDIIKPTNVFFGEKDFQQLRIIEKMTKDLNYDINIVPCKIIRESNGLAMSSRNVYLTKSEHNIAGAINHALESGKNLLQLGERSSYLIKDKITKSIAAEKLFRVDYVSVADSITLAEISGFIEKDILVSTAVFLGGTRLIDNFSYSISSSK